jgi:two-component system response regulator AtoC
MISKTILLLEDQLELCNYVELALRFEGYQLLVARDGRDVGELIRGANGQLALVLLDLMVPGQNGLETVREIRRTHPGLPILVFAGNGSPVVIQEVIRNGGTGFLPKPFTYEQLITAIRRAIASPAPAGKEPAAEDSCGRFFCSNPRMWAIHDALKQIAASDVPVVLRGESGVGKEVLAREIHALSPRRSKPFVKINCVALPSELLESELFGYERGAFTGAIKNTPGKFEAADGGIILLDEIGDMDFKLQAKLLHVLQDSEFQRLGSRESVKVNVRVLAATHCNLERAIKEKRFREDLYYRLNVITIRIPALRDRKDEVIPLAQYFLRKHALSGAPLPDIPPALERALLAHPWPGNIRELENVIRRYLVFPDPDLIIRELNDKDAPEWSAEPEIERQPKRAPEVVSMGTNGALRPSLPKVPRSSLESFQATHEQQEREAIINALNQAQWNRLRAATLLDIDYRKLLYKIRRLGIAPSRATPQPGLKARAAAACEDETAVGA